MDTIDKAIKELENSLDASPEQLEKIASHVYQTSSLSDEQLDDDNMGEPGGFAQLLSSPSLKQYISDSFDAGVYGCLASGQEFCESAELQPLVKALKLYRQADQRPKALWYLTDNNYPDTAQLASTQQVIKCLESIKRDAHDFAD